MRYLVLISFLLVALSTSPAHALETPPNILWQHKVNLDSATEVTLADCKVLHNGNLVVAGLYTGTGPLLGDEFVAERDPVKGAFVAAQSPTGTLLWLHRFAGTSLTGLEIDQQDNLYLANYSPEGVSLLGTTLAAETDAFLIYRLSMKADGSLNHLIRLGRFEFFDGFPLQTLRTICKPTADGCVLSLHFIGTLRFGESSYDSEGGIDVAWISLNQAGDPLWAYHLPIGDHNQAPLLALPEDRYLSYTTTQGLLHLDGKDYPTSSGSGHSLLIWFSAEGQIEKAAHFHGQKSTQIQGLARNSQGEILLLVYGHGDVSVEFDTGTPLTFSIEGAEPAVKYLCVSADFTSIRWQKLVPGISFGAYGGLHCDATDNLYATFSSPSKYVFERLLVKDSFNQSEVNPATVLKLGADGNSVWIRKVLPGLELAMDVTPDGRSFIGSSDLISSGISSVILLASDQASSAPEFHQLPLAYQVVPAQSTLYLNATVNGASDTIYYWLKDGVNLTNSTSSSLVLSNVGPTDLGTYTLLASNRFGTVSAGPFRFSLGPPSKLADIEFLQHIDTALLDSFDAKFSPNGRNYVVCGSSQGTLLQGGNSYLKPTFLQTTIGSHPPVFSVLDQPGISANPKSVITDAGQCFVMDSLYGRPPGPSAQISQGWLTGFDSSGTKLWELLSTGRNGAYFLDLALSKNTNLVVLASCHSQTSFGTGSPATKDGLYLIRLSLTGEVLSQKLLLEAESMFGLGTKFTFAPDGSGYIMAESPYTFKIPGGETYPADETRSVLLLRFDPNGDLLWLKRLPSSSSYGLNAVTCDAQGMVTCINYDGQPDLPGLPPLQLDKGIVVIRWNQEGLPEWHKVFDNLGQIDMANAVAMDAAGNIVLGLITQDDIQLDDLFVPANPGVDKERNQQSILVHLSRIGKVTDTFRIPSDSSDLIGSLDIDPKGRVLFCSGIGSFNYDVYHPIVQIGPYRISQDFGVGGFYGITAPLGPPLLTQHQGNELKLNWSEYLSGFNLESSPSPIGPWNPVSTATNSFTLDTSSTTGQFFRLKEQTQ